MFQPITITCKWSESWTHTEPVWIHNVLYCKQFIALCHDETTVKDSVWAFHKNGWVTRSKTIKKWYCCFVKPHGQVWLYTGTMYVVWLQFSERSFWQSPVWTAPCCIALHWLPLFLELIHCKYICLIHRCFMLFYWHPFWKWRFWEPSPWCWRGEPCWLDLLCQTASTQPTKWKTSGLPLWWVGWSLSSPPSSFVWRFPLVTKGTHNICLQTRTHIPYTYLWLNTIYIYSGHVFLGRAKFNIGRAQC